MPDWCDLITYIQRYIYFELSFQKGQKLEFPLELNYECSIHRHDLFRLECSRFDVSLQNNKITLGKAFESTLISHLNEFQYIHID